MKSQQVKCFLSVATYKNFSLAAKQLYLSQSVVSYHIHSLEKEVGFALFQRDTHTVELTPSGTILHQSLLLITKQYQEALKEAKALSQEKKNKLHICFGTPTSPTMMGQIVNQICQILSIEDIGLSKRFDDDVLQPLLSHSTDILFTYPPFFKEHLGLQKKVLCMTWTACMVHPLHPLASHHQLTLSDLNHQTLIFVNSHNAHIEHQDIYQYIHHNTHNQIQLETTPQTFDQAVGFAIANRGIMLVRTLDHEYHPNIDGLVCIPLVDINPMPLIAVWRQDDLCTLGKKLIKNISNH